jgi:hypothetical protein
VFKLLIVIVVFAVVTYLVTRMLQEQGDDKAHRPRLPKRPAEPPRAIAPDDDPEFLRDLDRKRRHPKDPDDS